MPAYQLGHTITFAALSSGGGGSGALVQPEGRLDLGSLLAVVYAVSTSFFFCVVAVSLLTVWLGVSSCVRNSAELHFAVASFLVGV